jgi:hypothetical protein
MLRCPVCESRNVVIVIGAGRKGRCGACGATWIQDGADQHHVEPASPHPAPPKVSGAR